MPSSDGYRIALGVKGRQLQQNYQNFPKPPKPRLREYKVPAPHQKRPGPPGDPWHFAKAPPPDNKEERFWRCLALGPNPRAGKSSRPSRSSEPRSCFWNFSLQMGARELPLRSRSLGAPPCSVHHFHEGLHVEAL